MMNEAVAEAMRHFQMGEPAEKRETCFVSGFTHYRGESVLGVEVLCRRDQGKDPVGCEFNRAEIVVTDMNVGWSMVEIPVYYLRIFGIEDAVLTEKQIDACRSMAEIHNAPYFKPADKKQPERVGNIRI